MRKVFIDLGAGSGDDIKGYYDLDPDNKNHEVFAFEPNPVRVEGIIKRFPEATVHVAAAGTSDTTLKLYLGKSLNTSSLLKEKVSVDERKYIDVEVIDFCRWMIYNFKQEDYITLVVDVEGAEYDLLHAMHAMGLWHWIDQIYVEFHGEKLENFDMAVEQQLTESLIDHFGDNCYIFRKHQHDKFIELNKEGI